ncbi:hypothetical protein [Fodinicola feengrottensis]|uniref:Uncharacterized protein n=1 Tax=Fodinicola feengrottensis TaxID=435914 RepID=A0ABP4RUC2_9ACTN|nr:hypothetical protein [Fodinicola feengrottensis]
MTEEVVQVALHSLTLSSLLSRLGQQRSSPIAEDIVIPQVELLLTKHWRSASQDIVRVACGRSLPAFSLASGYVAIRRSAPLCAGVRGCCRHYCRLQRDAIDLLDLALREPDQPATRPDDGNDPPFCAAPVR